LQDDLDAFIPVSVVDSTTCYVAAALREGLQANPDGAGGSRVLPDMAWYEDEVALHVPPSKELLQRTGMVQVAGVDWLKRRWVGGTVLCVAGTHSCHQLLDKYCR